MLRIRTHGLTHSNSQIPHPNSATFTQPLPPRHSHLNIPPPVHNLQHLIPNSFNFAPAPNPQSSVIPFPLPLGGQAHGLGTLGGENPWPVSNQTQLGIELLRRREVILTAAEQNLKLTEEEEEDDRSEGNGMIWYNMKWTMNYELCNDFEYFRCMMHVALWSGIF